MDTHSHDPRLLEVSVLFQRGLAPKVRFRDWTQSVQGAVATWSTKGVSNP